MRRGVALVQGVWLKSAMHRGTLFPGPRRRGTLSHSNSFKTRINSHSDKVLFISATVCRSPRWSGYIVERSTQSFSLFSSSFYSEFKTGGRGCRVIHVRKNRFPDFAYQQDLPQVDTPYIDRVTVNT